MEESKGIGHDNLVAAGIKMKIQAYEDCKQLNKKIQICSWTQFI